jgi:hypothetical protein
MLREKKIDKERAKKKTQIVKTEINTNAEVI